jgi:hypothetical protein
MRAGVARKDVSLAAVAALQAAEAHQEEQDEGTDDA